MSLKFSNFGKAIVASAPSGISGLSFTVEAGKGSLFPSLGSGDYFYGIFKDSSGNREIVKVEARSTDAMTIATGGRGLDGTTARTWAAGDYFVAGLVNIAMEESLLNDNLVAIGALTSAADKVPYFTGSGAADITGLSAFVRTLLDDADAAAARATLGAVGLTGTETIAGNKTFSGSVTPSQTLGIVGTNTNNDADAGSVGEFLNSVVLNPGVSLVSATGKNVTSISLTAGDWDLDGVVIFLTAASTSFTVLTASTSATTNTMDTNNSAGYVTGVVTPGLINIGVTVPTRRVSISSTTTYYLVASAAFSADTLSAFGHIQARRIR